MIQLFQLYTENGDKKQREVSRERSLEIPNFDYLFTHLDELSTALYTEDKVNLYYTIAESEPTTTGKKTRRLSSQKVLGFDIDYVPKDQLFDVLNVVMQVLEIKDIRQLVAVHSGNGLQIVVPLNHEVTDELWFDNNRKFFKFLCDSIASELAERDLKGLPDPSVFKPAQLFRVPNTINSKPHKGLPDVECKVICPLTPEHWGTYRLDLLKLCGLESEPSKKTDIVSDNALNRLPEPDTTAVLSECLFLGHLKAHPEQITEPQWFAGLSITARLGDKKGDNEYSHEISRGHPSYSKRETAKKATQALLSAGARTCKNIEGLWEGCHKCRHYKEITSPITIQGPDYIRTIKTGFRKGKEVEKDGVVKIVPGGAPVHMDLVKYYIKTVGRYAYLEGSNDEVVVWQGTHWKKVTADSLKGFAFKNFKPAPKKSESEEFFFNVKYSHLRDFNEFHDSTKNRMNLSNGVYDLEKNELYPHSPDFGFTSVLEYPYDPDAEAPMFDKFMDDITQGDQKLKKAMLEFAGYAISGDSCWLQKAMFMVGEGANGKSKFQDILKYVAGEERTCSFSIDELADPNVRYSMLGKAINISSESGNRFKNEGDFKKLVAGEPIMLHAMYQNRFSKPLNTKLIMAFNEAPYTGDKSNGVMRRIFYVPFRAQFYGSARDPHIVEKLKVEASGIFNVLIQAYQDLKARGDLDMPEISIQALNEYRALMDPVRDFCDECIDILEDKEIFISTADMYSEFIKFCEINGNSYSIKHINRIHFGKRLKHAIGLESAPHRSKSGSGRVYKGVKLKTPQEF